MPGFRPTTYLGLVLRFLKTIQSANIFAFNKKNIRVHTFKFFEGNHPLNIISNAELNW